MTGGHASAGERGPPTRIRLGYRADVRLAEGHSVTERSVVMDGFVSCPMLFGSRLGETLFSATRTREHVELDRRWLGIGGAEKKGSLRYVSIYHCERSRVLRFNLVIRLFRVYLFIYFMSIFNLYFV